MRLVFVENRYKTYLFEAIAKKLQEKGHEVHWIIQNKSFMPNGNCKKHVIPYPRKPIEYSTDKNIEQIIKSDRQINHFKKTDTAYFYYYNNAIRSILEELQPDVIFGEATAFHELLTIKNAKTLGILYLNPTTSRYPTGRFSFYKYDTLEPFSGSGELFSEKEALQILDGIVNKKVKPDYMHNKRINTLKKFKDYGFKIKAYFTGEKYNTPHPFIKYKIEIEKEKNITKWNKWATTDVVDTRFKVLYPLQMQPEANLDVWGRKYRDQTDLIKKIAGNLPEDVVLYIKPNPKSKYELSPDLIDLVIATPNIIGLHHACTMNEVFPKIDLVITVTGTIAIESILANKPLLTLTNTINNQAKNAEYLSKLSEIPNIIKKIQDGEFPKITETEKIDFINLLAKTSFAGIISDPYSDPISIGKENIDLLVGHFEKVLQLV